MRTSILLAATLLLPAAFTPSVHAASFDCTKAGTPIERQICGNDKLSSLDEDLSKVYRQVLDASPRPDALRASQRAWLREVRNACADVQCLTQAYQARLDDLIPPTRTASTASSGKSNNKAAVAVITPTPEPVRSNPIVIDVPPAIKGPPAPEPNVVSAALPTPRATSTFSFKIQDMSQHQRIAGKGGAVTRASEGKTLVVVRYSYKNLTTEPIGSMRLPSLALVSPDGVRSQPDAAASKAFVAGTETKDALTNDRTPILNPGMTANDAGVFEVRTDLLIKTGWSLVIEGDEDVKVPLLLQN